uniref:NADH-ubiquinone oxidoreductase chain 6 n=1 Tax=Hygrotus inaequalis TaxID=107886 RepID=A0A191ZRL6_9DYTI|nr:NADH dehydrogenase subunit 6 [Hygrotus inaequalis]
MLCIFLMISLISLFITMSFMFMNHPMSMGLILMIQTIMVCLISSFYASTSWFSYILFLIMIGGMLILFMYMTSLASNEKFSISNKMTLSLIFYILIMIIVLIITDKTLLSNSFKTSNFYTLMSTWSLMKNENMNSLNMIYNYPNNFLTILIINYLFLTMVAVVKITKSNIGPLRQKF